VPLLHRESSLFFHHTDGASSLRLMALSLSLSLSLSLVADHKKGGGGRLVAPKIKEEEGRVRKFQTKRQNKNVFRVNFVRTLFLL
jgi:hypothetical protein